MKNNKGFTLVEVLAVIAILGMLTTLAVVAYSQYIDSTKEKAYRILAKSAADAAKEYNMVYFGTESISLQDLYDLQFLENLNDPNENGKKCSGTVKIIHNENLIGLDTEKFEVTLLCRKHQYKYCYPSEKRVGTGENCPS